MQSKLIRFYWKCALAFSVGMTSLLLYGAEAPSVLTSAIFWLDAADTSTLTLENGNVLQWKSKTADQRTATWSVSKPTYDTTTWGIPTVDFGALGSQKNMTYDRVTDIRTIFCVVRMVQSGSVHLLGDSNNYSFHRGTNGAYFRTDLDQVAGTVVWDGRKSVAAPATDLVPDDSFRVICATRTTGGNSNCLAKDRNYTNRTGGKQYSELIVFDTVLSEADRIAVTDYLMAKWGALAAATAPNLISTALLRYDASQRANFTFDDGGKVTGWKNLGAGGADYDAFVPTSKRSATYYKKGTVGFQNDVPVYQMGNVGSAIDLGFKDITTARTVFEVADIVKHNRAFFLGWDGSQVYDFHTSGDASNPIYGNPQFGLLNGVTQIFADGVWAATTSVRPDGLHLFAIDLRANGSANRLSSDRDYAGGGQIGKDGGKALSELLIFERELSDIERVAVELALKAKWTEGTGWLDGSDLAQIRSTGGDWSATGAWTQNGAVCAWADGQIAVFDGADAVVTVDANVATPRLYFRAATTLSGSATVTLGDAPVIYVAEGAVARITAPLAAEAKIRKIGKGQLVFASEQSGVPGVEVEEGTFMQVKPYAAIWEGKGDRANVNDPLNWSCTDANGDPLPNGVPTAEHEILLAGPTTFNVPPGQTLAYKTLAMSSVTLEADCDWRGLGPIALADGMTVNTAGHALRLATLTSETAAGATITDTVGGGALHVDVPSGVTVTNDRVRVAGALAFVKEGEGTFVAALAGQTYTGGNDIVAGTFVVNGATTGTQASGYYGNGSSSPDWVTTVRSNAVFDIDGCPNHCSHGFVLAGGTLTSSRVARNPSDPIYGNGADWMKSIRLTADSTIRVTRSFGLVASGYAAATIDLAGHTLTFDIAPDESYWLANATLTEGNVVVKGGGQLQFGGNFGGYAVSATNTAFAFRDCSIRLRCSPEIGDYVNETDTAAEVVEGDAAFRVHGTWRSGAAWHSALLLPGATLDLSNRTGTWTNACTVDDATRQLAFVPESQITVNLAGREDLVNGLRVVDLGPVSPTRVTFAPDATTLERFMLTEDAQGLVLSAPVITARWTGAANDGDFLNSANWDCRDAVGEVVPDALPGGATAVTISGPVGFDMADVSDFRYGSLTINATLTRDCDWTALGDIPFPEGSRIDLNGHRLTVSNLKGAGTICSPCALNRAAAVPEIVRTSANFWLDAADASTLTTNAAGVVTKWTSKDANGIEATGVNSPTYSETAWGRPTVDFGAVGSQKDMSYSQRTIRTAFWVIRIDPKGFAPLLGHTDNSTYHFHRGPNGEYAHSSYNYTFKAWNGLEEVSPTEAVIPSATFQVIAEEMAVDAKANVLTRDRKYTDRSGGRQLSELICFPDALSDDDREAVIRYLQAKWMGACATGELCVNVPEGKEAVNSSVALEGNLKVVKEGAGRFVTGRNWQTYLGGNDVRAGEFKFSKEGHYGIYGNANENLDWVTTVQSNATLVVDGWGCHRHPIVLNGGHLDCSAGLRGGDMIKELRLTADSTMLARNYGIGAPGWAEATVDLAGHTLTATVGVENAFLYLYNTRMTAGTFRMSSLGYLELSCTTLNAPEVCFDIGCAVNVSSDSKFSITVGDYVCSNSNGRNSPNAANTPIQVVNRFTPIGSTFYHVRMLDGSTLDLSQQTNALDVVTSENCEMTFAPDAKVTVDLGNRKIKNGDWLLLWEEVPDGITFCSVPSSNYSLRAVDKGLRVVREFIILVR